MRSWSSQACILLAVFARAPAPEVAGEADDCAPDCNLAPPCREEPGRSSVWCDAGVDIDTRAAALVSNLTNSEKSLLLTEQSKAIPRLHLDPYNWWSEALHGLARAGVATSFPNIIGVASSFNNTLFKALGKMVGVEARGKNNGRYRTGKQNLGLTLWSPDINIFRDPRWGRGQEVPGEDPLLTSAYAVNYVQGLQGDADRLVTSACVKHFVAYSKEFGRFSLPAVVTKRDMADTYLPAFQAGIQDGKASCIMCSYNSETYGNGMLGNNTWAGDQKGSIPSCANKGMLNDLARKRWGFDGYIVSDCGAADDVLNSHRYTKTPQETINATLSAGMDLECMRPGGLAVFAPENVKSFTSTNEGEGLVDAALRNLFKVQLRLGMFDPRDSDPFWSWDERLVDTPEHRKLAKQASDQSLVLLKNLNATLPLSAKQPPSLALTGRNAKATTNMQGNYEGTAPFLISPFDGIGNYTKISFADGTDINSACQLAQVSDVTVLVGGLVSEAGDYANADEREDKDRESLLLPGNQNELIRQTSRAASGAGKKFVLVIMSGGAVDITEFRDSPDVHAIIWCGYPGQFGGKSIADVLFGAVNPSGRLTQTWYPESFATKVEMGDMRMRPDRTSGYPGRSYRFYSGGSEVFKFGAGMSYSRFSWTLSLSKQDVEVKDIEHDLEADLPRSKASEALEATVDVTNHGAFAGKETLLLFAAPPANIAGKNGVPWKSLIGYAPVWLEVGETKTVKLSVKTLAFALANEEGKFEPAVGTWRLFLDGGGGLEPVLRSVCVDSLAMQLPLIGGIGGGGKACADRSLQEIHTV